MKQLSALIVAGTALAATASSPALSAEDEIVVGAATSFSGWMAAFDVSPTHAAEIAVQDINAAGGVNGKKLKLVHIDTKTDQAQTSRAAQDLVKQGAKLMLTACDFDEGAPAALVAQQAKVIAISSCGADIKYGNLTIGNDVFTMATDAEGTGRILADWATHKKGWKTAYALDDTFIEYDKSECRGFVDEFKKLNGDKAIVLEDTFKNADTSVASQVSRYTALGEQTGRHDHLQCAPGHCQRHSSVPIRRRRYPDHFGYRRRRQRVAFGCAKPDQLLLPELFG